MPIAPLVLGLIRQETEFDPYAISSAGARGLMQMMTGSAKIAAKQAGLPYRPQTLLTDTTYNMQLGMTEYHGHLDRYGGSYVLAAASYNAGANNVKKWLAANGDPRASDPIDWIEQIPFGETEKNGRFRLIAIDPLEDHRDLEDVAAMELDLLAPCRIEQCVVIERDEALDQPPERRVGIGLHRGERAAEELRQFVGAQGESRDHT